MAEITDIPKHRNLEAFMLKHGKAGETFISIKETNYLCALAAYYKRKITAEPVIVIPTRTHPSGEYYNKILILQ